MASSGGMTPPKSKAKGDAEMAARMKKLGVERTMCRCPINAAHLVSLNALYGHVCTEPSREWSSYNPYPTMKGGERAILIQAVIKQMPTKPGEKLKNAVGPTWTLEVYGKTRHVVAYQHRFIKIK